VTGGNNEKDEEELESAQDSEIEGDEESCEGITGRK
jgi:hypothetical protein